MTMSMKMNAIVRLAVLPLAVLFAGGSVLAQPRAGEPSCSERGAYGANVDGKVVGGVLGGLLGSAIGAEIAGGDGGNRRAGAVVGGVLGAMIGSRIGKELDRDAREREDRDCGVIRT